MIRRGKQTNNQKKMVLHNNIEQYKVNCVNNHATEHYTLNKGAKNRASFLKLVRIQSNATHGHKRAQTRINYQATKQLVLHYSTVQSEQR